MFKLGSRQRITNSYNRQNQSISLASAEYGEKMVGLMPRMMEREGGDDRVLTIGEGPNASALR
jgi:hypothetical protein